MMMGLTKSEIGNPGVNELAFAIPRERQFNTILNDSMGSKLLFVFFLSFIIYK